MQLTERAALRMQVNREELIERIARAVLEDGTVQPLEGLYLARASVPKQRIRGVIKPSFCMIAQGSKEVLIGDSRYRYDPLHYLISTVELPWVSQILEASRDPPYLSLRLVLDPGLVGAVMAEANHDTPTPQTRTRAMDVSSLDLNLQDALLRLIKLLDTPAEVPTLMPLITREIVYRLLVESQGARLRYLVVQGGYTSHIARAVERIRKDFDQPLRIEELARELGMSVSGLQHRFKAVTAMSPMQYQKQLRLQEARRLMLGEDLHAAIVGFRVGYRDASYFNREYRSVFGVPPIRDMQQLREKALESRD
jgi:AraC-like DNA-binding protein